MSDQPKSRLSEDLQTLANLTSDRRRTRIEPEAPAFNGLSNAEAERLAVLMEELGEAQQAIGKILRHGFDISYADGDPTNREDLEKELGDVQNAQRMMIEAGDLNPAAIQLRAKAKEMTIGQFLHHQPEASQGDKS